MVNLFLASNYPHYSYIGSERNGTVTDGNGYYQIKGISPGDYIASVGEDVKRITGVVYDKNDMGGGLGRIDKDFYYAQTFHPGVNDSTMAKVLKIEPGTAISEVDIVAGKPLKTYKATGQIIDATTEKPVGRAEVWLARRHDSGGYKGYDTFKTDENGSFQIPGLLPGGFFVNAQFNGLDVYADKLDFEVTNQDLNGLIIKAYQGLSLSGKVVIEGATSPAMKAKLAQVQLYVDSARFLPSIPLQNIKSIADIERMRKESSKSNEQYIHKEVNLNAGGSFQVDGLKPGRYEIQLGISSPVWGSFSIDRIEPSETDPNEPFKTSYVEVKPKQDRDGVRVFLNYKGGVLRGHVNVIGGKLPLGSRIMVGFSHEISGTQGSSSVVEADANGNFKWTNLAPGIYTIDVSIDQRAQYEKKVVEVKNESEANVTLTIDLRKKPK